MTDRDLPPLNWLRAFESAARCLSFTDAARELHITQAAVSKQVKALEGHLRQPLFRRLPRSLELTRTGEAWLPKVQDALDRLAIGTREVFGPRRSRVLTVRCAVSFALTWLAPRLPAYLARHPDMPVRILSSVWSDRFDPDSFDLDIQYGRGPWPGVDSHRLTRERITPLCDPATAARLRQPADLAGERLLHVLGWQEGWGIWLAAAGVDMGRKAGLQLDTSVMAYALAAQGAGVALGRTSLAAADLAAGRLVAPFGDGVPVAEAFHLLVPQDGGADPHRGAFVTWLLAAAEE
jgi:LysR family transcriptional regulator, glycine cleavage system transcriptional activator